MLTREKFDAISKALKSGETSNRAVARRFGISHTLANKIRRRPERVRVFDPPTIPEPRGEYRRCPQCGAKTQLPCVACAVKERLRELAASVRDARRAVESDENAAAAVFRADPFQLNLTPDQYERYREVRRWRESRADPRFDVVPSDWPWLAQVADN